MRVKRVAEWETTKGKRHVWLRSKEKKKKNTVTCTVLTQIVTNIVFIIFFNFFFSKNASGKE